MAWPVDSLGAVLAVLCSARLVANIAQRQGDGQRAHGSVPHGKRAAAVAVAVALAASLAAEACGLWTGAAAALTFFSAATLLMVLLVVRTHSMGGGGARHHLIARMPCITCPADHTEHMPQS